MLVKYIVKKMVLCNFKFVQGPNKNTECGRVLKNPGPGCTRCYKHKKNLPDEPVQEVEKLPPIEEPKPIKKVNPVKSIPKKLQGDKPKIALPKIEPKKVSIKEPEPVKKVVKKAVKKEPEPEPESSESSELIKDDPVVIIEEKPIITKVKQLICKPVKICID